MRAVLLAFIVVLSALVAGCGGGGGGEVTTPSISFLPPPDGPVTSYYHLMMVDISGVVPGANTVYWYQKYPNVGWGAPNGERTPVGNGIYTTGDSIDVITTDLVACIVPLNGTIPPTAINGVLPDLSGYPNTGIQPIPVRPVELLYVPAVPQLGPLEMRIAPGVIIGPGGYTIYWIHQTPSGWSEPLGVTQVDEDDYVASSLVDPATTAVAVYLVPYGEIPPDPSGGTSLPPKLNPGNPECYQTTGIVQRQMG